MLLIRRPLCLFLFFGTPVLVFEMRVLLEPAELLELLDFLALGPDPTRSAPAPSQEKLNVSKSKYPPEEIRNWSYILRQAANGLHKRRPELASHFYNVHYAVGPEKPEMGMMDPLEFDPFLLDKDFLSPDDSGGIERLIESLKVIAGKGYGYVDHQVWRAGLGSYLNRLLIELTRK